MVETLKCRAVRLAVFFVLYFGIPTECCPETSIPEHPPEHALYGEYNSAAVAADAGPCSVIGKDLLKKGGSVVDAAIGTMLCIGLHNAHSTGIGGGSFMNIYDAPTGEAVFINAREVAPLAAHRDMYGGDPYKSTTGASAIAVPGEIAGYWEAHRRYGKLRWSELFEPAIKLASQGYKINCALATAIRETSNVTDKKYNLKPLFRYSNGRLKREGDIVKRPRLAATLRLIASEGASTFYNGTLARRILDDLRAAPGDPSLITEEDLKSYSVEVKPVLNITLGNLLVLSPGSPSGGSVLLYLLNILKGYNFDTDDFSETSSKVLTYHRIVEAFKFSYAKRSQLGDENFNKKVTKLVQEMIDDSFGEETRNKIDDTTTKPLEYYGADFVDPRQGSGTSHLCIVGEDGSAISMTSTINTDFGSSVRGRKTGIIFNNEMDDFASPNITSAFGFLPSPTNFIEPGKRPQSSMSPTIIINPNDPPATRVKMLAGAQGGSKITTAVALTLMDMLWFGKRADEAVSRERLHHQLERICTPEGQKIFVC